MSDDNVFEGTPCEMSAVPPVPAAHMLVDPTVPDAPPDIPDCGPAALDPLPPEIPDPPCPAISIPDGGTIAYDFEITEPTITFEIVQGECCDFIITLDVAIPCPAVRPFLEATEKEIPFVDTVTKLTFVFNKVDCEYDLDIDLEVHCPQLTTVSSEAEIPFVEGPSAITYGFTGTEECDYELAIDISIHCPILTPQWPPMTPVPIEFGEALTGNLQYGFILAPSCDYELQIEIVSPCPNIQPHGVQAVIVPVIFAEEPVLTYLFTLEPGCEYELEINVTVPCPLFEVDWDITTLTVGSTATLAVTVIPGEIETCEHTFHFDFGIPRGFQGFQGFQGWQGFQGRDGCGDFFIGDQIVTILSPEAEASVLITVEQDPEDDPCTYTWDFTFSIPRGHQGFQGDQGWQGMQGDQGWQGSQGWQGDMGPQGWQGMNGEQGFQGNQGFQGDQGWQGNQGFQGDQGFQGNQGNQGVAGDKLAIVPVDVGGIRSYVALFCTEAPEARFTEHMTLAADPMTLDIMGECKLVKRIDERFIQACEERSLEVVAVVPDRRTTYGARVIGNQVEVTYDATSPARQFNVTLSGIRRGYLHSRFRSHTAEEAEANKRWWSGWRNF